MKFCSFLVELEQMLSKEGVSLNSFENGKFSVPWLGEYAEVSPDLRRLSGSGSGGYADNILRYAAKEIFGEALEDILYKPLR